MGLLDKLKNDAAAALQALQQQIRALNFVQSPIVAGMA